MAYRYNPFVGALEYYTKGLKYVNADVTLTDQNINEKKITLPYRPAMPETTLFFPLNGLVQRYGVDYEIVGNDIIWSGMGLDGFLEINEEIRIFYQIED